MGKLEDADNEELYISSKIKNIINFFIKDVYVSTEKFHGSDTTIMVVWDRKINKNSSNWRNEILPEYKQHRGEKLLTKKMLNTITTRLSIILESMGIYSIFPYSLEADDVINHLSKTLDGSTVIVSVDKDFYQCVNKNTIIFNPITKVTLREDNFEDLVGVPSDVYVLYKSIVGDPSDNIKGLYRYGKVKAKKLVMNWEKASKKLDDEQMASIDQAKQIIDLNYKEFDSKDKKAVNIQLNENIDRLTDYDLTRIFDAYEIPHDTRLLWDKYFEMRESLEKYNKLTSV
jgi:5'-3' exonuclease